MPYAFPVDYVCPKCHKTFQSTHYKRPDRCPTCRKTYRAKQVLANYHKRKAAGYESEHKRRDVAYDGVRVGADPSVYSPTCIIHLRREVAKCQGCGNVREIINGYCELCRGNCANEAQCHDASRIA